MDGVSILHAGTRLSDSGEVLSNGGRVLSVTATGDSLSEARVRAYAALDHISLAGSHARRDIAAKAAGEI
jgi:phosphoribosylamine--glycine ligase